MGTWNGSDRAHPALAPYAATLHDDELDRLGADYDRAAAQLRAVRGRGTDIAARLGELDLAILAAADAKAADRLLTERARLSAERDSLPGQTGERARRAGWAHLCWLRRLWQLATAEAARCEAALARPGDENLRLRAAIWKSDAGPAEQRLPPARVADLHGQSRALAAAMQPTVSRQRQAEMVVSVCEVRATSCYGEGVRLDDERTWPAGVEAAARRLAPGAPMLVA